MTDRRIPIRLAALAVALLVFHMGCSDGDGPPTQPGPTPGISITVQPATLEVDAGESGGITVTLTRTGEYAGTVSLELQGLPTGVAGTFAPTSLSGQNNTSQLTIGAAGDAGASTGNITVRATGPGVDAATATFALSITPAPVEGAFELAMEPASLNIAQGGNGTATIRIARTDFTGAVALSVSGAPAGVMATISPESATDDEATLTVSVGAGTAPGNYTLTITGTADGLPDATASLAVTVAQGGGTGGNVVWNFCPSNAPIWLAYQNDDGPWTPVPIAPGTSVEMPIHGRGGIAVVRLVPTGLGEYHAVNVNYGTTGQLQALGEDWCVTYGGGKRVSGTIANFGSTTGAHVSIGTGSAFGTPASPSFTFETVADGPRDLLAARVNDAQITDRLILRRNIDPADGSMLPTLDFAGGEAFEPELHQLSVSNSGGADVTVGTVFWTGGGTAGFLSGATAAGANVFAFRAIPDGQRNGGDLHMITASVDEETAARMATLFIGSPGDESVTLGPSMSQATVSVAGSSPYARLRASLPAQAEYDKQFILTMNQMPIINPSPRMAEVSITAGYLQGTPGTWQVELPDLSEAGFDPDWGPRAGGQTTWAVFVHGWDGEIGMFEPFDGLIVRSALGAGLIVP